LMSACMRVYVCNMQHTPHTLQHATHCDTLTTNYKHTASQCNIQHTTHTLKHATLCITLQHTTTHCSTLQHTVTHRNIWRIRIDVVNNRTTTYYISDAPQYASSQQHSATHCNTLQHMQHTVIYCNTPQHTAAHSNTQQHTATHYNTLTIRIAGSNSRECHAEATFVLESCQGVHEL